MPKVTGVSIVNTVARMDSTLTLSVNATKTPEANSYIYVWRNGQTVIAGQESSTLILASSLGIKKGDAITCEVIPVYRGIVLAANSAKSSALVISNSLPVVDAGADVSLSSNALIRTATVTDMDVGDTFSYQWSQISGPSAAFDATSNVLSVVFTDSGTYAFLLSVSDGTDAGVDQMTVLYDKIYFEPSIRVSATQAQLDDVKSVTTVSSNDEADIFLDKVFNLSRASLTGEVVSAVINAVASFSTANVTLTIVQVSTKLVSLDNVVDENAPLAGALNATQIASVAKSLSEVLTINLAVVSTKEYLKALEVFDEVLTPLSSSGKLKDNLQNETQQVLGQSLSSIAEGAVQKLAVGENFECQKRQLMVFGEVFQSGSSEKVIRDSSGNTSMTLPPNLGGTNLAASVARMAFNPHANQNNLNPTSDVVSFRLRDLASLADVSLGKSAPLFASKPITLKISVSTKLGENQSFVPRYFDELSKTWSKTDVTFESYDAEKGIVSFKTTHLSNFAVFIENNPVPSTEASTVVSPVASTGAGGGGGGGGCLLGSRRID